MNMSLLNVSYTPAPKSRPCMQIWRPSYYEVEGKIGSLQKKALLHIMLQSYAEVGRFAQSDISFQLAGNTGASTSQNFRGGFSTSSHFFGHRPYISGLNFDNKGFYLASVSSAGCLAIHDYESIYCQARVNAKIVKPVMQVSTQLKLEAVSWNPTNQDEVACIAAGDNKVYCYDIACISCSPMEVLKVKHPFGRDVDIDSRGLFDITFCKHSPNKVLACGRDGNLHLWDRRASSWSQSVLSGPQSGAYLNCLELSTDEQVVYAGSEQGQIHAWDLRGGTTSIAFLVPGEAYHPPFANFKLTTLLEQISSLRAQTEIATSGVQSVSRNPYCGHQLAFHLNNGWSGVLDLSSLEITHIHCPPPPWLDGFLPSLSIHRRKPTWLHTHSVYASGSSSDSKIHLLDFRPGLESFCSVVENRKNIPKLRNEIPVSDAVVVCAAHPMTDHLMAGTEVGSLLLIAHQRFCERDDSQCDVNLDMTQSS